MNRPATPAPIAAQLWSLHEEASRDLLGVLERVAALGYVAVEPISLYGHKPSVVRRVADGLGLEFCSVHAPFPAGEAAEAILDENEELGVETLVWSMEPEEFTTLDGVLRGAGRVNEAAANAAGRGMRIAYHNHFAEFENVMNGERAYEILLRELDPAVVVELDAYWVRTAGVEPAPVAASLGDRLEFVHLKDGPARGMDDHMLPFGEGVVDVEGVARANPAVKWHIVEADRTRGDMYELLRACYDYLVGRGLATGRRPAEAGKR
ncbi:sugar phosphate isomerase/epimerase family protein [Planotetraspora kaengkrachanensis]|uniref:Xylose isomerase n=1 Tax=Planotetraspora kaengkrachanensis TaxID=575193 RepID=A0A8J3PWA4_9ACTN|nr:sugar phosphate isomerase/epimerase [Planotetraspora kaengkrachanensis]GIG82264.1 xylose isomerase [Planotetraspora kaengkrachanensis]